MREQSILIQRCQQGDREAWGRLYASTHGRLLKVCHNYVGDAVAEDLLHDAYVLIFSHIKELKDPAKADAWMAAVTRNVALLYLRTQKEQSVHPIDEVEELAEDAAEPYDISYGQLLSALDALPEGYRQVFRLSVLEGMSHQEIARLLHIAPHTSSSQLFRAKKVLRRSLSVMLFCLLCVALPLGVWHFQREQETVESQPLGNCTIAVSESEATVCTPQTTCLQPANTLFEASKQPVCSLQTPRDTLSQTRPPVSLETTEGVEMKGLDTTHVAPTPSMPLSPTRHVADEPGIRQRKPVDNPGGWMVELAYSGFGGQEPFHLPQATLDTNDSPVDTVTHHHVPLTIGLSVNKTLGHRLAIGTGVQLTWLSSETQIGNSMVWQQDKQRLRYLGIPLRLSWYPVRTARWSVYTTANALMELPLRSTVSRKTFFDGRQIESEELRLHPSTQWSVSMGVGLEFRLSPVIGIYAEPSAQYFLSTDDNISTWCTDHRLTFSVPLGIRITF